MPVRLAPVPAVSFMSLLGPSWLYRKAPAELLLHSRSCSAALPLTNIEHKNNEVSATQEKDLKPVENHILRAMVKSSVFTWGRSGLET